MASAGMKLHHPAFSAALTAALAVPIQGLGADPSSPSSHGGDHHPSLGLSTKVVPHTELGQDVAERPRMITEVVEDAIYPSNRKREAMLEQRAPREVTPIPPPRKTLFGDGDRFLGNGPVSSGWETPTGAVWQPYWAIYGQFRTGIQAADLPGERDLVEWANRLDLLASWFLSTTDRFHIGFRPLDDEGVFTGYTLEGPDSGWNSGLNVDPTTLFFESEFGELFPRLDDHDRISLDYGFSVGRQPLLFQQGIFIDDRLDGIGISRNQMYLFGSSAARVSFFWAPGDIHRNDNREDEGAQLVAFLTEFDREKATFEVDAAYVSGGEAAEDGVYVGLGQIRRYGYWNSTLRANASWAPDGESAAISSGYLLTSELSRTMPHNEDILYVNTFWGIDEFASAARGPATGGPLGRMGLLYQAVGLGNYGAPLNNRPEDSVGFALGYQHFWDHERQQLLFEFGGRSAFESAFRPDQAAAFGLGVRYQRALNQHAILVGDTYLTQSDADETGHGGRVELRIKF